MMFITYEIFLPSLVILDDCDLVSFETWIIPLCDMVMMDVVFVDKWMILR